MTIPTIHSQDVRFFSSNTPLLGARLFSHQGELYRAIAPSAMPVFEHLRSRGTLERLADRGLTIETTTAPFRMDGAGMVLHHRKLPFVTFPHEWSALALKDAALCFLDLCLELAKDDVTLIDGHAWNILFDGATPRFIDFGSFVPLASANNAAMIEEFHNWFVYPLQLMSRGQHRLARAALADTHSCLTRHDFEALTDNPMAKVNHLRRRVTSRLRRLTGFTPVKPNLNDRDTWTRTLTELRQQVRNITIADQRTAWSGYAVDEFPPMDQPHRWTPKQQAIAGILQRLAPGSVHDLAGNSGWYSLLAATYGCDVICTDVDETCLNNAYRLAQRQGVSMNVAYMDLRRPTPAMGWTARPFPAESRRLRADCVLVLALLHHMVFRHLADFPLVLDSLAALTGKDLVLEFVSPQDRFVSQWWNPSYDWYTLDHLVDCARQRCRQVTVVNSHPEGRYLLVCEGMQARPSIEIAA